MIGENRQEMNFMLEELKQKVYEVCNQAQRCPV